ncbi:GlxA family transcriptional regulator [Paraburkholderia sp. DD10]|uniref:Transcriptional regulator, AraC family n=1 Tax=Paraburkholderia terricola TaxID=169427 RepID=A0A1M6MB00_9BURK|nr:MULTISPECIES: helix-turn-helix domain-containing protein [Paraburkholderia]AXE91432.1 AraC family transcriptional regulator [Paraburkholderia terricola]ORC47461.1 AraC family transcriptional regulator [Burkholderia sp. A27]SDN97522.1 transcriptional regulator, AraC family [Paraburkholderia sediminicola]SHJ80483.1 transcriptional regulator, AraC family [Paraburkholderia terricola]
MTCASLESAMLRWVHAPNKGMRRIAILMFNDCSLQGAGVVAEVFQAANELASSGTGGWTYDVSFLSADGGMVTSSSALRVWTDGLDARHYGGFDALYVAGGKGAAAAAGDERLIAWLRRIRRNTGMIRPIAEGRALLEAAYVPDGKESAEFRAQPIPPRQSEPSADAGDRLESMRSALAMIKRDLGSATARTVAERLLADSCSNLAPLLGEDGGLSPGDKVRAAARWLQENCQQAISIADAAQFAAMSERNFLRRFKMEMGITPSSFLLHERLAVTCSLLTESELPVDKIARRTGMGNGDRLAKVFRKRMRISPTEFRIQSRRMVGE